MDHMFPQVLDVLLWALEQWLNSDHFESIVMAKLCTEIDLHGIRVQFFLLYIQMFYFSKILCLLIFFIFFYFFDFSCKCVVLGDTQWSRVLILKHIIQLSRRPKNSRCKLCLSSELAGEIS